MWPAGAEDPMGMGMGHGPGAAPSPRPSTTATTHSAWQSPVPYLFGGLAAMLGLIALSLLALACSYWKLSGSILAAGEQADDDDYDLERRAGGDGKAAAAGKAVAGELWREHVVVIMAGDERPTFLATPASGRGGMNDDVRGVAVVSVGCRGGGSGSGSEDGEDGRCVECGARSFSWPARAADDDDGELSRSRSEQSGGGGGTVSGRSVISER